MRGVASYAAAACRGRPGEGRSMKANVAARFDAPQSKLSSPSATIADGQEGSAHAVAALCCAGQFDDPAAALAQVQARSTTAASATCAARCRRFVTGEPLAGRVRACYPFVRVQTDTVARADSRLSYGFVAGPGHLRDHADPARPVRPTTTSSSSACCWRTTAWRSRSAPARSRSRCISRSPSTTTSKAT